MCVCHCVSLCVCVSVCAFVCVLVGACVCLCFTCVVHVRMCVRAELRFLFSSVCLDCSLPIPRPVLRSSIQARAYPEHSNDVNEVLLTLGLVSPSPTKDFSCPVAGHEVAVAGDSAGGTLAFGLLVRLAQLQRSQPQLCIGISPWLCLEQVPRIFRRISRRTAFSEWRCAMIAA